MYDIWTSSVAEKSQFNLQKPLISREHRTRLISVNFSPQVSSYMHVLSVLILLSMGSRSSCECECYLVL